MVSHGWHAEIGIPVTELDGDLAFTRAIFPGARTIMFGYGKQTFITAPVKTFPEYLLGPFPGPAVIQTVALNVTPPEAYAADEVITLALPPDGAQKLADYIWGDLAKDESGKAILVSHSTNPDGLFYAADSIYTLFHTCNAWAADALHAAGLPVSGDRLIFSGQTMSRAEQAAAGQCP